MTRNKRECFVQKEGILQLLTRKYILLSPLRICKGVYGMAAKWLFKATLHSQYVRDFLLKSNVKC